MRIYRPDIRVRPSNDVRPRQTEQKTEDIHRFIHCRTRTTWRACERWIDGRCKRQREERANRALILIVSLPYPRSGRPLHRHAPLSLHLRLIARSVREMAWSQHYRADLFLRTKQHQEQISRNHVQALFPRSVHL